MPLQVVDGSRAVYTPWSIKKSENTVRNIINKQVNFLYLLLLLYIMIATQMQL